MYILRLTFICYSYYPVCCAAKRNLRTQGEGLSEQFAYAFDLYSDFLCAEFYKKGCMQIIPSDFGIFRKRIIYEPDLYCSYDNGSNLAEKIEEMCVINFVTREELF